MCRMIASDLGDVEGSHQAALSLRSQAARSGTGPASERSHPDGWGLVVADASGPAYVGRSASAAPADAAFDAALQRVPNRPRAGFLVGHVRNASVGIRVAANAHPFVADGWAFCHNGTINGAHRLVPAGALPEGATDSEAFFHILRGEMGQGGRGEDAIVRAVSRVDETCTYSSLTFFLTNGRTLYALRRLGSDPSECLTPAVQSEYYGLGFGRTGAGWVVAQERTHLRGLTTWTDVPHDGLLVWDAGGQPRIQRLRLAAARATA